MTLRVWCALLLVWLAVSTARAEAAPAVGTVLRAGADIHGRHVPLPPGDWTVVGRGFGEVAGESPGPYGSILGVMLVQQTDGVVDGVILVSTNVMPIESGWGPAPECNDRSLIYATGVTMHGRNLVCAHVSEVTVGAPALTARPGYAAGRAEIDRRGWRLPDGLLVTGFRVSDRRDVLDLRYAFRNSARLTADAPAAYAGPDPLGIEVRRKVMEARIRSWIETVEPRITAGLAAPPAAPEALAAPWAPLASESASAKDMSLWTLNIYKLISYRIVNTSLTFAIAFVLTGGNVLSSSAMVFWQASTHMALFYANEMYWEWPTIPPIMALVDRGSTP